MYLFFIGIHEPRKLGFIVVNHRISSFFAGVLVHFLFFCERYP